MKSLSLVAIHEQSPLSFEPDPVRLLLLRIHVCALAMHLAVFPLAYVGAAVRPLELAITVPFVIEVVALVDTTVRPSVLALAIHVVVLPLSHVLPAVEPFVCPLALHLVAGPAS